MSPVSTREDSIQLSLMALQIRVRRNRWQIVLHSVALEFQLEVNKYFLGFVVTEETPGLNLKSNVIREKLKELHFPFDECR